MEKPTAAQLVTEINKAKGNVSAIARAYGRPRSTVYTWIDSYESAKQALADQRELVVDVAESKLFESIEKGELSAVFYTLNNSKEAKARGWGNRVDVTSGGEKLPQPVVIIKGDEWEAL